MNAIARTASSARRGALVTIVAGGALSATIDLIYACTYHGIRSGVPPVRILQSIASGLLGRASYEGGIASAALGFAAHYLILIGAAAIYYAASRRFALLTARPMLAGMIFGVGIYCTMNFIVLPLSAAPHFKGTLAGTLSDFAVHVLLLGPAIAFVIRRFGRGAD
ncbi:MAG TPA: hypothetical protein VJ696_00205 [Rhodanobacteraceae bacterium]|nr:hypothetical protein [Rhodanobacteraceae bacterium]